ncbi:ARHGAP12 [Bugula neritina]|uniref:ARHGAP12 n=1 Tax=Bugula neritina TaxID=10212 RepID=A0A7J7K1V1_BUGNE|nr:ARHGAP12 [Bugula neritina]
MEVIGASDSISIHTDIPSVPMNGHHREHSNASSYADSLSDGQSYSGSFDSKADTLNRVSQLQTKSSPSHVEASQTTNKMLNLNLQPSIVVTSDSGSPSPSPEEPEVTYANMQIIQEIIAERREKHVDFVSTEENNWQKLKDSDSGKMYYFNPVTKETTWDSPGIRRKNQLNALNHATPSPLSKRLSRVSSFRKGWTETVSEDGDKVYVHNATGEKWHMAVDESGKEYYYKENSQESLWELPEISEGDPSLPTNTNTDWPHGPRSSRTALSSKEEPHPRRASVDNLNARSRNNVFANKALTLPATFSSMSSTNEDQAVRVLCLFIGDTCVPPLPCY